MGDDNEEKENKHGEPYQYEPDFKGPVKDRSCTDVLCCILIALFFVAFVLVGIWSFAVADPSLLLDPVDSDGYVCGHGKMSGRPYLFFFDLLACARTGVNVLLQGCPTPQVCLTSCPDKNYLYLEADDSLDPDNICIDDADVDNTDLDELVKNDHCAAYYVKSKPVLGRCLPKALVELLDTGGDIVTGGGGLIKDKLGNIVNGTALQEAAELVDYADDVKRVGTRIVEDIKQTWWLILIFLIATVVVSLLWLTLLRFTAAVITWLLIFAFAIVFGVGTAYCFYRHWELKDDPSANGDFVLTLDVNYYLGLSKTWLVLGIICSLFLGIILIMVFCLWERIRIAVAVIEQASKALAYMMSTLLWPIIPFLIQVTVLAYGIASFLHIIVLASGRSDRQYIQVEREISNITNETTGAWEGFRERIVDVLEAVPCDPDNSTVGKLCQFLKYGDNTEYSMYVLIFQVFAWFWVVYFISAIGEMVLAGAFASYYWAFKKPEDIPRFPLLSAIRMTFRYHIGSVAFGSLLIALIKIIQSLLEYLHRKFEKEQNSIASFAVKCLKCCCWCIEKIVLFINRNAYILIAVHGSNFCSSAWRAFNLILRNILRVAVVDKIADFLMFIGRVTVMGIVAVPAGFFFAGKMGVFADFVDDLNLNYYMVPVVLIVIGAYIIAYEFFTVYAMGVDTIFLSFLEDLERNDGSPERPYYMSKDLMSILGKKNVKDKGGKKDGEKDGEKADS